MSEVGRPSRWKNWISYLLQNKHPDVFPTFPFPCTNVFFSWFFHFKKFFEKQALADFNHFHVGYWRLKIEGCKWPLHIYYWFFASLTLSRTSENFTISHWNALLRDFDEFVQKFQKKYATSEEYESTFSCHIKCFYYGWARKRIFENNRRKIRAHNALNGTSS